MSLLIDSLRRFWTTGIATQRADPALHVSTWLARPTYFVTEVPSADRFTLTLPDIDEATPLFAATANKTFSACFETMISIAEVDRSPRSLAWALVKLYYAAYFGAHGVMRACGRGCINLDAVDTTRVLDNARAYGIANNVAKINSGLYSVLLDTTAGTLSFVSLGSKGSHEALWYSFAAFLDQLVAQSPALIPVEPQRKLFDDKVNGIKTLLCLEGANGGNWLSKFRNLVQYRQGYGAWHPYSIDRRFPGTMLTKTDERFMQSPDSFSLKADLTRDTKRIETFVEASSFLSALARELVVDIGERSTDPQALIRIGSLALLRKSKLSSRPT